MFIQKVRVCRIYVAVPQKISVDVSCILTRLYEVYVVILRGC